MRVRHSWLRVLRSGLSFQLFAQDVNIVVVYVEDFANSSIVKVFFDHVDAALADGFAYASSFIKVKEAHSFGLGGCGNIIHGFEY